MNTTTNQPTAQSTKCAHIDFDVLYYEHNNKSQSLRSLAKKYGVAYSTLRDWYSDTLELRADLYNNKNKSLKERREHQLDEKLPSGRRSTLGARDGRLRRREGKGSNARTRMPRYGELEPTFAESRLGHLEWLRKIGGERRFRWDYEYLHEMYETVWEGDKIGNEYPRFHGKTESVVGVTSRGIAEWGYPVLEITNPFLVRRLFRLYKRYILSPEFRLLYGDILGVKRSRPDINNQEKSMYINEEYFAWADKDPAFQIISKDSAAIGGHPGAIILDDIIQRMSQSDISVETLQSVIDDDWFPMLSKEIGVPSRVIGFWTRKEIDDIYSWLVQEYGWQLNRYPVAWGELKDEFPLEDEYTFDKKKKQVTWIDEDAVERWDLLNKDQDACELLTIKLVKPVTWASQYMNMPIPRRGSYFNVKKWRKIPRFDGWQDRGRSGYPNICVFDSAYGMKEGADFNCLVNVIRTDFGMVITDIVLEKNWTFEMIKHRAYEFWKKHRPTKGFWVHATAREAWIYDALRKVFPCRKYVEKVDKILRIEALDEAQNTDQLYVFDDINSEYLDEAMKQVRQFDRKKSTATKKDDFLDVMATAWEKQSSSGSFYVKQWY